MCFFDITTAKTHYAVDFAELRGRLGRMTLYMYHIPVCPFSQRVEILLSLKGLSDEVSFNTVDITKPRPDFLLELTKGTTAMPVIDVPGKTAIKESMVILRMIEEMFPEPPIARTDPHEHALESLLVEKAGAFTGAGYMMVMNQDADKRDNFRDRMLGHYRDMNDILVNYAPGHTFFFDRFGWSEVIFTPMFMRFWFLEYYEDFELPEGKDYDRVRRWREACLAEPHAQQVTPEQISKLYYDYARGAGNGALPEGRSVSTFTFKPHWTNRPMPPKDKYGPGATDEVLGLV